MFDIRATVTMFDALGEVRTYELPSRTTSLVAIFQGSEGAPVELGALTTSDDGRAFEPGREAVSVRMQFWEDEGRRHVSPGVTFDLWYGGVVGRGVVDSLE